MIAFFLIEFTCFSDDSLVYSLLRIMDNKEPDYRKVVKNLLKYSQVRWNAVVVWLIPGEGWGLGLSGAEHGGVSGGTDSLGAHLHST